MKTAAGNQAGAITGFMGMGMASQMGGINAADLYRMAGAQPQQFQQPQYQQPQYQQPAQQPQYQQPAQQSAAPAQQTWTCSCGNVCTGKFCPECGKPRPSPNWRCACGTIATGKFCPECGAKRPD
jgi:membrane protease subunit (stomatin/prohibitin family)